MKKRVISIRDFPGSSTCTTMSYERESKRDWARIITKGPHTDDKEEVYAIESNNASAVSKEARFLTAWLEDAIKNRRYKIPEKLVYKSDSGHLVMRIEGKPIVHKKICPACAKRRRILKEDRKRVKVASRKAMHVTLAEVN